MNGIWGYHCNVYAGLMTNFLDIIHYPNSYFKRLWDRALPLASGKKKKKPTVGPIDRSSPYLQMIDDV
jgi:hypothetical protein